MGTETRKRDWVVDPKPEDRVSIVERGNHWPGGAVATLDYTGGDAEEVGRLIAAAPQMYEALKAIVERLENYPNRISGYRTPVRGHVTTLAEDARAVLEAADGRA